MLIERKLLLLNSVRLWQNPHNVAEWHKRVWLYEGQPHEIINTYTEAVQTVQPQLAIGKLNTLWIAFGKLYEQIGQIEDARSTFEKATHVSFTNVNDVAPILKAWEEMEFRHGNGGKGLILSLLRSCCYTN